MSNLLDHAKAYEALAAAYAEHAKVSGLIPGFAARCNIEAAVHRAAAAKLREQAKAEATAPATGDQG